MRKTMLKLEYCVMLLAVLGCAVVICYTCGAGLFHVIGYPLHVDMGTCVLLQFMAFAALIPLSINAREVYEEIYMED